MRLSNETLGLLPDGISVPTYNRARLTAGIVHIGLGNFHRAHQGWYLHRLMQDDKAQDWAIVGAGVRAADAKMRDKLLAQDCLTTLIELAPESVSAEVIGSMIDFLPVEEGNGPLIRRMAETDALTGAANRRAFMQYLDVVTDRARRDDGEASVVMVDLDHFKRINDTHGHAAGDRVLIETVRAIQACLRERDMLGRLGGEEFAVILPGAPDAAAIGAAERIRGAVEALRLTSDDGTPIPVTASLGVAALSPAGDLETAESLLQKADEALYAAKAGGRNCVIRHGNEASALRATG